MRGTSHTHDPRGLDFAVVPTEVRHGPGSYDVTWLANGRPITAERRALHARHVAEQLERFPEGQFVAVARQGGEEVVIGTATTLRTRRPPTDAPLRWRDVIGDYGLPRHDPDGHWLYGVEIAVHPDHQRRGVASALYRARLALVEELGLDGWYAGGMLMGYHRYADVLTPRAYAERVIAGELVDPTVTMQMNRGLQPRGIVEDYDAEPRAGGCAVLLVWEPQRIAPVRVRVPAAARVPVSAAPRPPSSASVGVRPLSSTPPSPRPTLSGPADADPRRRPRPMRSRS